MHNIQLAATQIVRQVLEDGRNLNQVLDESLRRKSVWTPAQRAALQDLSYGTLRHYGQLKALRDLLLHRHMTDARINLLLLVALYQLQYSKAAQHAVVDHAVRSAEMLNPKIRGLVNAILRNFLRNQQDLLSRAAQTQQGRYSYPQWWIDEIFAQYGEQAGAILDAGNCHPPMTLRVNRRSGSVLAYLQQLAARDMAASCIEPEAVLLEKPVSVDKLPGFFEAQVSVQDAGAQYAARLLDVCDGMRVLDACAAPGGKTAHILELAEVELLALDKDEQRLQRVAENLQRLGLAATLKCADAARTQDWWDGQPFDRILADVPCSATGVVRRHPDIKWLRRKDDIAKFSTQQSEILRSLWATLAPGGKLLYATCSIFDQENQNVIDSFLKQHSEACQVPVEIPSGRLIPNDQHDGFFYALLQKTA
ncbi:MAG: 16S rRNA (cytosine(967)-C(5))-methyltransferase RsmB [Gallionella sp.]|nr:16S rRNA (cytosine(967)-C(5))-methyltransferase RsmB [Gallionella sp.]MDD4945318.1 16S rRNA (cytosine(967)-C(5))-methyltransferase RsmB [Gallionella sp.]MDD5612288.1 16S rRNA (cytosine(967)-C(5))-methyltransferase RsmB [Gallionella sp.]